MSDSPLEGATAVKTSEPADSDFEKKKRKRVGGGGDGAQPLNINSLLDIMTILLVFLIKSYSANPIQLQDEAEMRLPTSTSSVAPQDAVPIAITTNWILVDNQPVVQVENGKVRPADKEGGQDQSFVINPLKEILLQKREEIDKMNKYVADGSKSNANQALVLADTGTPSRLLTEVLNTAGQAEFNQFRFAVIEAGEPAWSQP